MGMPITPELFVAFIDAECDIPKVLSIDSRSVRRINSRQQKSKSTLISNRKELLSYIDSSLIMEKKMKMTKRSLCNYSERIKKWS